MTDPAAVSNDDDGVGGHVAMLGAQMKARTDELTDDMVERIRASLPVYQSEAVNVADLRATCLANVSYVVQALGREPPKASPESRENGRKRAKAGVPLSAGMEAYRIRAACLWEHLAVAAEGTRVPTAPAVGGPP